MMMALSWLVSWELLELAPRQQRCVGAARAALASKSGNGRSPGDEHWMGDGSGQHHLRSVIITPVKK